MGQQEIVHWPFRIYKDNLENLYIHDMEEGVTFVRDNVSQNKYSLAVIFEENCRWINIDYSILDENDQPCGFQLFDELSQSEWTHLARDYIRNKRRGEKVFRDWINQMLYSHLDKFVYEQTWLRESMPPPGASKKALKDFDRDGREHFSGKSERVWIDLLNKHVHF